MKKKKIKPAWTKQMIDDLKSMPKFEFMKKHPVSSNDRYAKMLELGINVGMGFGLRSKVKKYIPPDVLGVLGTDSDVAIAKRLGLSNQTVKRYRESAGIPLYKTEESLEKLIAPKSPLLEKARAYFLGKFADSNIPIVEMSDRDVVKNVMAYFCKKIDDGEL